MTTTIRALPAAGNTTWYGHYSDLDAALREVQTLVVSTQTVNYTAAIGDANTHIRMNQASASTFTIPPNSSVAYPVGTALEIDQLGAGQVTVTPGSGVTLQSAGGLKTRAQYSVASALKVATDTWIVSGDTTP